MNIRHLEILEAVAQIGTFTGAAAQLYLTQSAVSHAIAELEQQAGAALFDRLPRGVRPTACGQLLLEEAAGVLTPFRSLSQRMRRLEDDAPIHLASSITIASFQLPSILRQLPGLRVQVQVVSAANAMDILRRGHADMALVEGAEPQGPFHSRLLGTYGLLCVCGRDYPLAADTLTPESFCAQPLLLRERGSAIRDTLDSTLYLANLTAQPLWESVNSNALLQAAEAGLGVTVLPDVLVREPLAQNRLRRLEVRGLAMENKMLAVYRREQHLPKNLQRLLQALSPDPGEQVPAMG